MFHRVRAEAVYVRGLFLEPAQLRVLLLTFLVFLPVPIVGTLAHEAGHIAVAHGLGYETTLHYGSMDWRLPEGETRKQQDRQQHELWVALGGPIQTVLTGMVGLIWLVLLRRGRPSDAPLRVVGWCATLLALFWSRQLFNLLAAVAALVLLGSLKGGGDEARVSSLLGWPTLTVDLLGGLLGFGVCVVVLVHQPAGRRWHFILAGPLGCFGGFLIWYFWLGPFFLP